MSLLLGPLPESRDGLGRRGQESGARRENVCLVKTEARQRQTPGEKGWAPPSGERHGKEVVKSFI